MSRQRPKNWGITLAVNSANALPADEHRQSITFSPALVESYSVGFGEDAVINRGLTVRAGMQPFTLTREQIGDAITLPMAIVGSGVATAPLLTVSGPCCRRGEE